MNTMTPEELTRRVLIEHWRRVYGPLHPLIGTKLWEPVCQECGSVLHRSGEIWACSSEGCSLQGKPAPADLGIDAVRKVIDADEVLSARLVDGHRTSQREAFTKVGHRITGVIGGNRGGKSVGAASVGLAFSYGRNHPATRVWAEDNGFNLEEIPNAEPHVVYAISPTHEASVQYTRPTMAKFLPEGTVWHNRMGTNVAMAHLPGPNGEPPNPMAQPGEPGFYGCVVFKAVKQTREAFQGAEIVAAWFDEEPLDAAVFKEVVARCADWGGKVFLSMTPLSGYTYLYHRLIRERDPNAVVHPLTGLHNSTGRPKVRAEALAEEALVDIREGNPALARQRIYGVFGDAQGLVYAGFSEHVHVFDDYAELPPREECEVWGGFDDGTVNPLCYLHAWYHPKTGTWWTLAEVYGEQMSLADLAEAVRVIWKEHGTPTAVFADSAADRTIRELRSQHRIGFTPCTKAPGSVRDEITHVCKPLIAVDVRGQVHYRVHRSCENHRREFGQYAWPKGTERRDPQENPMKHNDHSMDAFRYMLSGRAQWVAERARGRAVQRAAASVFGSAGGRLTH